MLVCYVRSSSLGTMEFCEQKYFLSYVVGLKDKTNKKACLGSIVHKAMEVLAYKSVAVAKGEDKVQTDDFGELTLDQCDDIDHITRLAFDFYDEAEPKLCLEEKDYHTCVGWVNKAIEYNNGMMDPRKQNVYTPELFFDIEIKKPWAKFDYKVGKKTISGYLSIKGTIDLIINESATHFHMADYKGLPVETPIPTLKGWSTMGGLNIGDIVFDQYGKQTKVIAKSTQKIKECYEITFDDTSKVICDDEHYWKLSEGEVIQIEDLKPKNKINVSKPLICEKIELPIDPYIFGIWLGDGRNRSGEITSADDFIFDEIEKRGYFLGDNQEKRGKKAKTRTIYGLTTKLRSLGVLHNKHIPPIYLRASFEQRLDLLRGLMDSDGSVNKIRKQCIFMNCTYELSKNIKELLLSLGQRPLISETIAYGFGLTVKAFPVSFRPININPFLLPIKRDKVGNWGAGRSDIRQIRKIEKIGQKLTQCISVDSPDKTYLCTENMIPTHNTGKRYNWGSDKEKTMDDLEKDKQLLLYYYALKTLYPDKEFYISIYYINDGGVFTFPFDESDFLKAEEMIKREFQYIKSVEYPKLLSQNNSHFKCQKMCAFSQPFDMSGKSICHFYRDEIKKKGIDKVTEEYANLNKIQKYQDGGGRLAQE